MLSWNQVTLLIVPWLLLGTTYLVYQLLARRFGKKRGYLGGFLFYWIGWCLLFPLALLGPHALVQLFRSAGSPFGQPWWLGAFCLLAPPLVAYVLIFPKALQKASRKLVLVSALLALINGPLEEMLWRGAFITLFPGQFWLGLLYPRDAQRAFNSAIMRSSYSMRCFLRCSRSNHVSSFDGRFFSRWIGAEGGSSAWSGLT